MTNRIGCQAPDLFAALAPVMGPIADGESKLWKSDPYDCPPLQKPLPTIYFHGTHDAFVRFHGGGPMGFPSVPSYVKRMKERNGIAGDGVVTYTKGDVECTAYGSAASNFTFCKHSSGHCWPGRPLQAQVSCTDNIDATAEIWSFFKQYKKNDLFLDESSRSPSPSNFELPVCTQVSRAGDWMCRGQVGVEQPCQCLEGAIISDCREEFGYGARRWSCQALPEAVLAQAPTSAAAGNSAYHNLSAMVWMALVGFGALITATRLTRTRPHAAREALLKAEEA